MTDELGYRFHDAQHPSDLGCLQLEVNLYGAPTKQHFDPEEAIFPVASEHGEIQHKVIAHPWRTVKTHDVCVGRIILRDRLGKTVEAFSFGGKLTIAVEESHTTCHLRSSAPVLALTDIHGLSVAFASEVESLLARQHAAWNCDDHGFEHHLTRVEPDALFVAALVAVAGHLDHALAERRGQRDRQDAAAIHRAIERMKAAGAWPTSTPTLDDLLTCPD